MEQTTEEPFMFLNVSAPNVTNTTFEPHAQGAWTRGAFWELQICCYAFVILVGGCGNTLVCKAIFRQKKLKTNEYFILNLALTDLATSFISVPFDAVEKIYGYFPFGPVLCKVLYPFQTVLLGVSVLTLLFMSVERYGAIMTPFRRRIREKTACQLLVAAWIFSVLLVLPYASILGVKEGHCVEHWRHTAHAKAFTLSVFVCLFDVPLLVIMVAYALIVRKLYKDTKASHTLFAGRRGSCRTMAVRLTERSIKMVKISIIAVVAFAACLLPNHVMWMWHDFGNANTTPLFNTVLTFTQITIYFNSVLNPFIFGRIQLRSCKRMARNSNGIVQWKLRQSARSMPRISSLRTKPSGVKVRVSEVKINDVQV